MTFLNFPRFALATTLAALALTGCETTAPPEPATTAVDYRREDIRVLRTRIPGKSMQEVVKILGQPTTVYTIDGRENWTYRNRAYDPVTKRDVNSVEIIFEAKRAGPVNFSY